MRCIDKYMKTFFVALCLIALVALPVAAFAADSGGILQGICNDGVSCGFSDLMKLVKNVLDFLLILSVPIAAAIIAYGGFLMITAAGDEGKIEKAKAMFWRVVVGFIVILCAWLIVRFITTALLNPNCYQDLLNSDGTVTQQSVPCK